MKSITLILMTCILFSLNSCAQDFKKLNDSEVNMKKVEIAKNFATNYLNKLKNGSYYEFQDEATLELKALLTEQKQKAVHQQLKNQFGEFQSLDYAETWTQGSTSLIIYRFKGDFDMSNKKLEVRVVLNKTDKIAGLWIIPWSDILR